MEFNHCSPHPNHLEICMLSNNIMDYYVVSQGKTSIPGVDDGEELELTDVRTPTVRLSHYTTWP